MKDTGLTRTGRARREDLVAAAIRVIVRDGLAMASVERIAVEAGTSKGTALYHFGGKEAIFEALVTELYAKGRAAMTERVDLEANVPQRLRAYLEANLRFIAEHGDHVLAVQRIVNVAGISAPEDGVTELRMLLEEGQRQGALPRFDVDVAARTIRLTIDAVSFHLPAVASAQVDHVIDEMVALTLRSVGVDLAALDNRPQEAGARHDDHRQHTGQSG